MPQRPHKAKETDNSGARKGSRTDSESNTEEGIINTTRTARQYTAYTKDTTDTRSTKDTKDTISHRIKKRCGKSILKHA